MSMQQSEIRIRAHDGHSLGILADHVFETYRSLVERLGPQGFKIVEGMSSLMGAGEPTVLEIIIKYTSVTAEDLQKIEQIISLAKETSDEIEIVRTNK